MRQPTRFAPARLGTTTRLLGGTLAALLWAGSAHADLTIIEDTFTAADGTPIGTWDHVIPGTACSDEAFSWRPDTYLPGPGAGWMINVHYSPQIQGNVMRIGADSRGALRLASTGTYARPSKLRISADMTVAQCDQDGGFWLGFNTTTDAQGSMFNNFTGLALAQNGRLTFRRSGGEVAGVDWAGGATFDKDAPYHLSYQIDTVTGSISNIALAGSTADYSSLVTAATGQFTLARTPYACIYSRCGNGGNTGYVDNFKVERVGDALPPAISFTPANGSKFISGSSPTLATSVIDGTGAMTVKFYAKSLPGGSFSQVGGDITTPPYQVSLPSPANGDYEVYASVTDDLTTVNSTHSTITLQPGTGLINVDFNSNAGPTPTFSGAAAVGSGGDQWNGLVFPDGWAIDGKAYSFTSILDSNGAAVGGVSVDLEAGHTQCFDPWGSNTNGSGFNDLAQDYIAYDPRITVNGLTAGYYDFYLYGTRGTYAPVSVNGSAVKTFNGMSGSDTPTLEEARDYLKFPVLVGGDGKLEFHATDLGGDGWAYRIAGFQVKAIPANTPPVVTTVRPANAQQYSTSSTITAKADFYYGTPTYKVQFWVDGAQVGGDVTAAPYEMNLGSLSLGSHTIYTKVIDSSTGGGGPFTVVSPTNTFTVAAPSITVEKDWTWNAGPEVDFSNFLTGSSTPPVHSEGQVIVPSGTYLRAENVLSNSPVNFGMEVIVTQQDSSTENRWIASARTPSWGDVFQFRMENQSFWARNDQWGDWAHVEGLAMGTEHRMAIIVTASPGDTQAVTSYYLDNVFIGSRSDALTNDIFTRNPVKDVSIGVWHGNDQAGGATAPAIRVNQIRVFHFGANMFSPSLLLTAPTIAPDQAPVITMATPTEGQLVLTPDSVSLSSYVAYGTPPFSVQYSKRLVGGGAFSPVGATATSPPYSINLGTLAAGDYEIKATVTDSNGVPRFSDSAIRTITVATPAITVDKQYTFNSGAEIDLAAYGSDALTYAEGQVTLPPNAYLKGTSLYSLPYRNFGMEVIMTQTSNTEEWRSIMHVGSQEWNAGFHMLVKKGSERFFYRDDQVGDVFWLPQAIVPGTEYRLAIVVTQKPDGNVLKSCYLNSVLVGTRTDGPWDGWTMNDMWLGAIRNGETGWDGPYTTIKVNEARVFHFEQGKFHPSLLLTGPTGGVTPPTPTYASWASDNGIKGQPADGDFDYDGVANAVEMVLGGDPQDVMDAGLMPTLKLVTNPAGVPAGNYLEFTYRRTDLSVSASVAAACQYNTNLGLAWATATDGENGVKVLVDDNYYGSGSTATDRVRVYVPRGANTTLFGRLNVTVP